MKALTKKTEASIKSAVELQTMSNDLNNAISQVNQAGKIGASYLGSALFTILQSLADYKLHGGSEAGYAAYTHKELVEAERTLIKAAEYLEFFDPGFHAIEIPRLIQMVKSLER